MTETTLYERLLGIERPWRVHDVRLALEQGDVEVGVEFVGETLVCPACGAACPGYDRRPRTWRHLDTMQYRTLVRAEVPRLRCAEHGVQQVPVPWADAQARFTALFEAMVIDWLKVASFAAVARQCRLSWDQVAGIQARAVRRGLSRRAVAAAPLVGVDETSFQRRHEYVTVVNDRTASQPRVLYVADGRDRAALDGYAPRRGGRPGPAVGEPGLAATRRRPAGEDALPEVDAPCEPDAAATPGVHAAAHERVAGSPCVGDQGIGDAAVALPVAGLGGPHVEPLDQLPRAFDHRPLTPPQCWINARTAISGILRRTPDWSR